jgi:hypothetical protein
MNLQPVTSSNVYATAHEGDAMYVMFLSGDLYTYSPIAAEKHQELRDAHSIGAALNRFQKTVMGTKVELPQSEWIGEDDESGNTTWTASSPYHDDGTPLLWRIKPRLSSNQVEWYEAHDGELMGEETPRTWPNADVAKAIIGLRHLEIMRGMEAATE